MLRSLLVAAFIAPVSACVLPTTEDTPTPQTPLVEAAPVAADPAPVLPVVSAPDPERACDGWGLIVPADIADLEWCTDGRRYHAQRAAGQVRVVVSVTPGGPVDNTPWTFTVRDPGRVYVFTCARFGKVLTVETLGVSYFDAAAMVSAWQLP